MSEPSPSRQSDAANQQESGDQKQTEPTRESAPLDEKIRRGLITAAVYSDGEERWTVVYDSRVLRIFMSSTFRDMQKERDEFFANAEKKLKDFAKKKGVILVFIDLRWGLTSEISENGLVVISCLESIEECPYFLCTLGSRYGWSPNHENPSEWHPDTDLKFPYLKEIRGLSVTDYEIVHGALRENPVARRALFYSRDEEHAVNHVAETDAERALYRPVNEKDRENQDGLKEKIGNVFEVKPYKTPQQLVSMMVDDLMEAIDKDFPDQEHKNPEDMAHEQFMRHRLIGLEGRDTILAILKERAILQLDTDGSDITVVGAESGIGKSTIMSGLVRDLNAGKESDLVVIYHFVGCSNLSNYVENLVERVARILVENEAIELKLDSEEGKEALKKGLDYILKLASRNEKKQVILVIDAFNQLVNSEQYKHVHRLEWLPKKTPKNTSIVVSTIDTHESCDVAKSVGLDVIPVSKLDDVGIRQAATSFFKRYNKTLNEKQMEMILSDRDDTGHPLYLRIVLDELRVFGVYERVDTELHEMLATKGVVNLFDLVMNRWEKKYGKVTVRLSISVIYVSRIGLDENELDKYMEHRLNQIHMQINHATWKSFLFVLLDSLFVRNGRYAFSHQLLTQSIKERYFKDEAYTKNEAREYGLWLLGEYGSDTEDKSVVAEICHILRISSEYDKLVDFMKSEKVVVSMLDDNYRFEFYECWRVLNKNGYDHKAIYRELAKQLNPAGSALVDYFQEIQENAFLIPILEHRISVETDEGSNSKNLNFLGNVYRNLGKNDKALEYYRKSLEIQLKVFGEIHPHVAMSYNNIGLVYYNLGKHDKALEYYHKSLEILLKVFGEVHTDVAESYNNIGVVYNTLGKNEKALEYYHKSLEIKLKVFGEVHPGVATSYMGIGIVYKKLGKNDKALEYFHKSLEIRLKVFGEVHPDVAESYNNIGAVYSDLGKHDKVLEYLNKVLEITLKVFGEIHPSVAITYYNMGSLLMNQKKYHEAVDMYQKANTILKTVYGADHPHTKFSEEQMMDAQKMLTR